MTRSIPIAVIAFLGLGLLHGCGTNLVVQPDDQLGYEPTLEASEVIAAFENNNVEAARLYKGKRIRISGYLSSVTQVENDALAVILRASSSTSRTVRCTIRNTDSDALNGFSTGDPINVAGVVNGPDATGRSIAIDDCRIKGRQ